MRRPQPDRPSLIVTRWLALLVTAITAARGTWILAQGISLSRNPHHVVGPAGPDFQPLFAKIAGCLILAVAASLIPATIRTWRREDPRPLDVAKVCILVLALISIRAALPLVSGGIVRAKGDAMPSGPTLAYAGLLLACVIAGIKAAIDLKRDRAQPPGFPVVPPPLAGARPDFEISDDLPG